MNQIGNGPRPTWLVVKSGILLVLLFISAHKCGADTLSYFFSVFAYTGFLFSALLGIAFVAGVYVIADRAAFVLLYGVFQCRLTRSWGGTRPPVVFHRYLQLAREFRATSAEGVYTDDIVTRAKEMAVQETLDGQEIDRGKSWLEFLAAVAPTIGFAGTLVGLIQSFSQLSLGGKLSEVLAGLALSMTTSLLGAIISVIFVSVAWWLGKAQESFDSTFSAHISEAQRSDTLH